MTNFSDLVLGADTKGLLEGVEALEDVVVAGGKAEDATEKVGDSFKETGEKAEKAKTKVSGFSGVLGSTNKMAVSAAKALGGLAAGFASYQTLVTSVDAALKFNAALAETSTLIEGTPQQMELIANSARNMAKAYGGNATPQVQAFYQALSAGAESVEAANVTLEAANKLAIGGVTGVTDSVGIISGVINSYGKEVINATQVSDSLFVGMKTGVTTIGELSSNLGGVIPTAKALGLTFDEVVAATAALTKNNLTTSAAVTSLNAVLVGVVKPTSEASKLAEKLGIEFNAAGLQAKGLGGFLADVVAKTGGNVDAMAQLFGSVEALKAALLFAGEAGGQYADIMDQMAAKAGATDEAFNKISESLSQRWNVILSLASDATLVLGNALLSVLVPAIESSIAFFGAFGDNLDLIVPVLIGLAATSIPAVVASLTTMTAGFTLASVASGVLTTALGLLRGAVALAGGPWGILAGLIAAGVTYLGFFSESAGVAETAQYDSAKGTDALNAALGVFHSTAAPAAGKAAIDLANDNYKLAESAYQAAEAEIAKMAAAEAGMRSIVSSSGGSLTMEAEARISAEQAKMFSNRLAAEKALKEAMEGRNRAVKTVMVSDGAMAKAAEALNAEVKVTVDSLGDIGGSGGGSKGVAKKAADGLDEAAKSAKKLKDEMDAPLLGAIDGVSKAFGDFIAGGLRDFKGFVSSVVSSFTSMLSEMITMAAKNKIMIGLGMTGSLSGGAASAATGIASQGAIGSIGSLGTLGSIGSALGSIGSALAGGFLNAGSALLSGGLSGLASTVTAQIGAAMTGSMTAIAGAIGAVALPVMALVAVFSFFKKKVTELDSGLVVTINNMDSFVKTFRKIETSKYWGLSKKTSTSYNSASAEVAEPIELIISNIQSGILTAAMSLGVASEVFNGFSHELRISTKGLSEADAQKAIEQAFTNLGDAFAEMIPGLEEFALAGEGAMDAINRLAASSSAVNIAMDTLGHSLFEVSLAGAAAASYLESLFGGSEAFNAATTAYFEGFYTEEERFETSIRQLTDVFDDIGLVMPTTRDQFRSMVEALDLTTEYGKQAYAALVGMSAALDKVLPSISAFTIEINSIVTSISSEITDMLEETTSAITANESAAKTWYATAATLRDFIVELKSTSSSLVSAEQARAYNEARYQMLLSSALAGDSQSANDLAGAASALLASTSSTAKTALEEARAQARVIADLSLAAGASDIEGARHDVIASLLTEQSTLLQEVADYLTGGNGLDSDQIDLLSSRMASLDEAIASAEMINYAFLKERINVSVDLIASADIPEELKSLLSSASKDLDVTVDFIARSSLSAPQMWLAVNAASEHLKTVSFLAGAKLDNDTSKLALAVSSEMVKTVKIVASSSLTDDMARLALTSSSTLIRTVKAILSEGSDASAMRLALGNLGSYDVAVKAALSSGLGDEVKRIVLSQTGSYTAMIWGAYSASGLSPLAKRVLLDQQGSFIANITGVLASSTTETLKALLLNANTYGARAVTISTLFASALTVEERSALQADGARANRTIKMFADTASIGPNGLNFLTQLSNGVSSTGKSIKGFVDVSSLTDQQSKFLSAINGVADGKLVLGGTFLFDPSAAFKVWYESTTSAALTTPMSSLKSSLDLLKKAMLDNLAQQEIANAAAARKVKEGELNAYAATLATNRSGAQYATDAQINKMAEIAGVSTAGGVAATKARVEAFSSTDNVSKIYNDNDWSNFRAYLKAMAVSGVVKVKPAEYLKANPDVAADPISAADPQGHFLTWGRAEIDRGSRGFYLGMFDWAGAGINVPGFETGGMHSGGYRIVGEGGAELEATGPARYHSASQTKQLLSGSNGNSEGNSALISELKSLRQEVKSMREEQLQLGLSSVQHEKRSADMLRKWDVDGLPLERV